MSQRFLPRVHRAKEPPFRVKSRIDVRPGGVELTPNGIRFSRANPVFRVTRGGGKRGIVRGFSPAAARRLRELLFRCDFHPTGKGVIGLCLTLPSEAAPGLGDVVWNQIRTHRKQFPGVLALIWRKERQRNGREHYHCILWTAADNPLPTAGALVKAWCRLVAKRCETPDQTERRMLKAHCKGNEALFDAVPSPCTRDTCLVKLIDAIPCLSAVDAIGKGVQYLIDHTSRYKRHQAKTVGRGWGVWNRRQLPRIPPEASRYVPFTLSDEYAAKRLLQRLTRFRMDAPCVFGKKMSRGRRFASGSHIVPSAGIRDAFGRWLEERGG